ncbi:Trehalose synthase [Gracilariopsis chorda]|uniref:Trehalose synthase n=1 Tax=Gracilariopsis chorda TaxID=448386 RepID=A0A2V3IRU3_9FLOR|nr:Trehalose synthase [Gracilariopsis chorda]|eukprot:PXF44851.1 Trehalose synthase [Gracilariopsis chorda]
MSQRVGKEWLPAESDRDGKTSESQKEGHDEEEAKLVAAIERSERETETLIERLRLLSTSEEEAAPESVSLTPGTLSALQKGIANLDDVRAVKKLCKQIVGEQWERLQDVFFKQVEQARNALPKRVLELENTLPQDWYKDAWYQLYVQYMGVNDEFEEGNFDTLRGMLPYLKRIGFRNLWLLPHYESPMADGGYDVSRYEVRESLGGQGGFERFMNDAFEMGFRIGTDGVFNHTSIKHDWFQSALNGEERYINYYVQRNGREKIGEFDRDGEIVCKYRDPDGTITERSVIFPDMDRTHGLWVKINNTSYQMYRSFYPFQVDLNLQNVAVLEEILRILGRELCGGVVAKRMDAAMYWVKKAGCKIGEGEEVHCILGLFKAFMKVVNGRSVMWPEVVADWRCASRYGGKWTEWNGVKCSSEGDLLGAFGMQAALREGCFLGNAGAFWRGVFERESCESCAEWVVWIEDHDEIYMEMFPAETRGWVAELIKSRGGVIFRNGRAGAGRVFDCLGGDERRVCGALVLVYFCGGTPLVFMGTEVCARSSWERGRIEHERFVERVQELEVAIRREDCFDGRWLHRGAVTRGMTEGGWSSIEVVKRLNEERNGCEMMRNGEVVAIDSGAVDVVCVGRGGGRKAVMAVVNMSAGEREVCVAVRQARALWRVGVGAGGVTMRELLRGGRVRATCDGAWLRWRAGPYESAVLRIEGGAMADRV